MKIHHYLPLLITAAFAPLLPAAESENTAEFILTTPATFEGKEVVLDVAFVKPVKWKSPIPELAFFHAMTIDRRDQKAGGGILVIVHAAEAAKFAKKYGTDFDGKSDSDKLKGILVAAPGRGPRAKVWVIDTTGKAQELVKAKKLALIEEGEEERPGRRFRRNAE